jgi:sodium-dependent dicarboxylate transporter 2/3/5
VPGNNRPVQNICLIAGPILAILVIAFVDLDPEHPEITRTAAVALLMAIWWISEAVPLAVTSLLPVVLFPTLGILRGKEVAPIYFNHIIFLLIGGFLVALAMEKWNLHRRIALKILLRSGVRPRGILLGSMIATWFLSMWIANTASTMMMVPIALALIVKLEESLGQKKLSRYSIGLFIGIAYSASIGGIATLVGTPPNLSFIRILAINFPNAPEISFSNWFLFSFPASALMLIVVWLYLSILYCPGKDELKFDAEIFRNEYKKLGPLSFEEGIVLCDFFLLVFLWLFRQDIHLGGFTIPGWSNLFGHKGFFDDGTVAITMAIILFTIPSRQEQGKRIMDWKSASKLPWGVVLLLGGGFALASGFMESGLSMWIGNKLVAVGAFHPVQIIGTICLMVTFLTELTSNTATAEMLLPILAAMSSAIGLNPLLLMIPATLSCTLAFMLPVATPPNAIVFGTRRLRISDMAKTGFVVNLLGAVVITTITYFLGRFVFDISPDVFPDWAMFK